MQRAVDRNYRAQWEIIKYRNAIDPKKKWLIEVPVGNKRNELEIVRQATRPVDPPVFEPMTLFQKQLIALFCAAACLFGLLYLVMEIW